MRCEAVYITKYTHCKMKVLNVGKHFSNSGVI